MRITDTGKLLFSRATLKIYDRPTLRAVVQGIQEFDLAAHDGQDFKGDMYEYLLSRLAASGTNGQFRTPRHIIDLTVPRNSLRITGHHLVAPAIIHGAGGGTRTRTTFYGPRILSPVRLPFRHTGNALLTMIYEFSTTPKLDLCHYLCHCYGMKAE